MKRKMIVVSLVLCAVGFAQAEILVDFDFSGLASKTTAPLSATDVLAEGVLIGDGLTPGGTVSASNGNPAAGEYNWQRYNETEVNGGPGTGWMALTLTAETGSLLDLSSVTISAWRNGAGAPADMRFAASTDGGTTVDQVGDIISEPISGDSTYRDYTFDLSSLGQVGYVQLRFSPLPGDATSEGVGNVHVNDLVVEGSVVPEPATLALLGIGGLLSLRRRK